MTNEYYGMSTPSSDFLAHYGIKGMKWGVKRSTINKKVKSKRYNERGLTKKQEALRQEWAKATKHYDEALADRNRGINLFRPSKQRKLDDARHATEEAAGRFFDSMTDKQRQRYHDKYLY